MWLRYLSLLSLLVSCQSYSVTDLTEIYQTQLSNIVDNYTYYYNLHTFADNTSINPASANTSSYLHTYVDRGGFVLDFTHWQDNSSGTPSNLTNLPLLKVTQRWEVNSATASPDTILVSMTIRNNGSVPANIVTVNFDLTSGLRLDISSIVKNTSTDIIHTQGGVKFQWYSSSIAFSEERFLSFVAVPSGTNGEINQ